MFYLLFVTYIYAQPSKDIHDIPDSLRQKWYDWGRTKNVSENYPFFKEGWVDYRGLRHLQKGKTLDDLQTYILEHSEYVFEGKVIKDATFYSYNGKVIWRKFLIKVTKVVKGDMKPGLAELIAWGGPYISSEYEGPAVVEYTRGIFFCNKLALPNEPAYYTENTDNPQVLELELDISTIYGSVANYDGAYGSCSFLGSNNSYEGIWNWLAVKMKNLYGKDISAKPTIAPIIVMPK